MSESRRNFLRRKDSDDFEVGLRIVKRLLVQFRKMTMSEIAYQIDNVGFGCTSDLVRSLFTWPQSKEGIADDYKGAHFPDPVYPCVFDDCCGGVVYPPELLFYWSGRMSPRTGMDRKRYKPGFYCEECLVEMVGLSSIPNKSTMTLARVIENL